MNRRIRISLVVKFNMLHFPNLWKLTRRAMLG